MEPQFSRHHIVPKSRLGADDPRNLVTMKHNVHVAFHVVFDNMTPDEQLLHLLRLNRAALRREFSDKVARIIEKGPDWVYVDGVHIPEWMDKVR